MEYVKLVLGLILLPIFSLLLIRNGKRVGVMHSLMRVDTLLGIAAGAYLIINSIVILTS